MDTNNRFIRKVYLSSLLPNIIAVLGGTVNVFFDGIMVGQKLGEKGLASVNQSLPIYLILCTIGSLFASGASFLSSLAIGGGKKEEGQRIFKAGLTVSGIVGLLFCIVAYIFSGQITSVLSTPDTYDMVLTYVRITLIGGVFKVLLYVPFFYLRLEGKNNSSATAMLTMTLLNIVLDFLFLFVLDFGIAGAAWASVIATVIACIMCFVFLFTNHPNFKFGFAFFDIDDLKDTIKYGSPMALNNVLSSARILVLNLILKSVGGSAIISVFAVVNNINEFSICIQNGVPQTASAMTGVFFGEKDLGSVKKLLNIQLITGTVISAVLGAVVCAGSGIIGGFFGCNENCSAALICFAVSLIFATLNNVLSYYFNVIGRISLANTVTVLGGFAFTSLFCLLFKSFDNYIWLFLPASHIATTLAVLIIGKYISSKRDITGFYLLDESFEKSGKTISFSVECQDEKICEASDKIRDFCELNEFSSKKTMAISLAIEEILTIISQKSLMGQGSMDVRVLKSGEEAILRVRSGGRRYNPIEEQNGELDYLGVQMITKMATNTEYISCLGVNTLIIYL